jgi:hypothetical protein
MACASETIVESHTRFEDLPAAAAADCVLSVQDEGPYGVRRYTKWREVERFTAALGSRYAITTHACCLSMAAARDGARDLMRGHGLRVADLAAARVARHALVGDPHAPDAPLAVGDGHGAGG